MANKVEVFVFTCRGDDKIHGYTLDQSGTNLPRNEECLNGWKYLKSVEISDNPFSLIGDNAAKILRAIAEQGYYLNLHDRK
jgi:hypothetical protein